MIINEDEVFVKSKPPNPWARISEVAAKVGVKPCGEGLPLQPTLKAIGADGKQYDVWEVLLAVLNTLDKK